MVNNAHADSSILTHMKDAYERNDTLHKLAPLMKILLLYLTNTALQSLTTSLQDIGINSCTITLRNEPISVNPMQSKSFSFLSILHITNHSICMEILLCLEYHTVLF